MFSKLLPLAAVIAAVSAQNLNSTDPTVECTPYSSNYVFPAGAYPPVWVTASTNISTTAEFLSVYNSIDWTKVPNIPPKKFANGAPVFTNYSTTDPDCWWTFNGCTTPKYAGLKPDIYTCPEPDSLGLSYDDGPNCSHNAFYDYLLEQKQKATMFYIGSNVADWPLEALRGFEDGHHISIHTWSHQPMTTLTNQQVVAELYYTRKVIKYVVGVTPLSWRPPYGDVDDRVRAIAAQLNMTTIIWELDTYDYDLMPAGPDTLAQIDANFQNFVNMGKNGTFNNRGTIILEHELNNGTMNEAVKWLTQFQQSYKHVVPIATCQNWTKPYAESTITYPTFAQMTGSGGNTTGTSTGSVSPTVIMPTTKNAAPMSAPTTAVVLILTVASLFLTGF